MRVLIYSDAFAPRIGGVETVVMSLAAGLASTDRDVRVTLVTATPRGAFDDGALPFRVVRRPGLLGLVRLIRTADVVHIAGPAFAPLLAGLLLRKPVVVEHHGFQAICPNGQLFHQPTQSSCPGHFMAGRHRHCIQCNAATGLHRSLKFWLLTFPRRWLCTRVRSNITPTQWLSTLLKLPRITMIYHGLPDDSYTDVSRISSPRNTFTFVGRLVSTKGAQTLLHAVHQLSLEGVHCRLKVIGDGPDGEVLRQQAASLGLEDAVEFLGFLSSDALEDCLAESMAVVIPSLAGEVFGMVAAESMSRSKVLIVSDLGALREVVADAGLSFVAGDSTGLARQMKRVMDDAVLFSRLGDAARKRASEQFSLDNMLLQHLQLYREATRCDA
jgi:glycogen synthase